MKLTDTAVRNSILRAGVKNLKEFGYPDTNAENILTDYLYRKFFKSMLEDDENKLPSHLDHIRLAIIAEIDAQNSIPWKKGGK